MKSTTLQAITAIALSLNLAIAAAHAETFGPGDVTSNANDNAPDLIAVDLTSATVLAPGLYRATDFSYQFTATNGTIQPLILTGPAGGVTTVAAGTILTGSPAGPYTTAAFGGSDVFAVGSGNTTYGGIYWDGTALSMPVGFANGVGSSFLRFSGAAAPVVGSPVSGGTAGNFARAYDFAINVQPVQSAAFGNNLSARAASSDTATTVFYTNAYGAPVDGKLYAVDTYIQDNANQSIRSMQLFQLRPTGVANQYDVIASSQVISPSGPNGTYVSMALATPFDMQQGDMIGHYGAGVPWTQNDTSAAAHNNQFIYFSSPAAPTVGNAITLGPTGANPDFPLLANLRDYAYSFRMQGWTETVGNGAGQAFNGVDSAGGLLVVMDRDPITLGGKVFTWQFFNDTPAAAGRELTPVLLREEAGQLAVIGLGETRVATAAGFQQWDFDLAAGTDWAKIGDLVGFYYGDTDSAAAGGAIEYTQLTGATIRLFATGDGIQLGESFASGAAAFNLPRYYSFNVSVALPAPAALPAGLALMTLATLRRRRR